MEELRTWYLDQLRPQLEALENARRALQGGAPGVGDLVRGIAHTLRGSGATYGYPEISEAASSLEDAPERQLLPALDGLIDVVERILGPRRGDDEPGRILVAVADESISRLLEVALGREGFQVHVATSGKDAWEILGEQVFDVLVLDLILPDTDGRTLLSRLRSDARTASLSIVVMTIRTGAEVRAQCEALGADEFLAKPFEPPVAISAVRRALETSRKRRTTRKDPVTELLGRAAFAEQFRSRAGREGARFLALFDLDRFRSVLDTCDRQTADRVLHRSAALIAGSLSSEDVVGRWEGDRFAALLDDPDLESARERAEHARRIVAEHEFPGSSGSFHLTVSVGLVELEPGADLDDSMSAAGHRLYLAKQGGRDRVVISAEATGAPPPRIVMAEDDEAIARAVGGRLQAAGFEVAHCPNGAAALGEIHGDRPRLVMLDVRMPAMDGFEVLERLRADPQFDAVPIVMLTSRGSEGDIRRGMEAGANDYIVKPVSPDDVLARVQRLLGRWVEGRLQELAGGDLYGRAVATVGTALSAAAAGRRVNVQQLRMVAQRLVEAMRDDGDVLRSQVSSADPAAENHLMEHSVNVAVLGIEIGEELGLSDDDLEELAQAALLHEIGSVRLPEGLLERSELDVEERRLLRERPRWSAEIIRDLDAEFVRIAEIVDAVHERWDGSGYPSGLSGEEVPLGARILGAVDVYEACTHRRVYRPETQAPMEGIESLVRMARKEFDEAVVKAMIRRIGLFPVGSWVELSSGEVGRVLEHRAETPMRPLIAVLFDPRGKRLERARVVDLMLGQPVHVRGSLTHQDLAEKGIVAPALQVSE